MSSIALFARRFSAVASFAFLAVVAGCSGGSADVVVVASPPPITALGILLTRIGPETVQVDWTNDPNVQIFTVNRQGYPLVNVRLTTTVIDNSVLFGQSYCYQVLGYDRAGNLIAATDQACIALV